MYKHYSNRNIIIEKQIFLIEMTINYKYYKHQAKVYMFVR